MFLTRLISGFGDLLQLFFPSYCIHCSDISGAGQSLCSGCRVKLIGLDELEGMDHYLKGLFDGRLPLERACALYAFKERSPIQSLLHGLKYKDRKDIGREFGRLMGEDLKEWKVKPDFIVPVPIHPKKRRKRGYNQAEVIAEAISENSGIAVRDIFERVEHSGSNTKLSRWERWENVGESFSCRSIDESAYYLLIDDVLTTGATIEACIGKALQNAPGSRWGVYTAAVVWRD